MGRSEIAKFLTVTALLVVSLAWVLVADDEFETGPESAQFVFARVRFNSFRNFGWSPGWAHDYPRADRNLLTILEEVTQIKTSPDSFQVVDLDDPEISKYPLLYFSEPGGWAITEEEAKNFREYLMRGGFAIFDDFDGRRDWWVFSRAMKEVFPERELVRLTADHPVFKCFFDIQSLDMTPPYNYGADPEFWGMSDDYGRLQVVVNFNNDIGDLWEWSDESYFPIDLSNEAYRFGVNYVVYALSH